MENFNGIRIESLPNLFCFRRLVLSVGQEQPCLLGLKEWPGGERSSLERMRACSCLDSCAPHVCEILLQQTWLVCSPDYLIQLQNGPINCFPFTFFVLFLRCSAACATLGTEAHLCAVADVSPCDESSPPCPVARGCHKLPPLQNLNPHMRSKVSRIFANQSH